MRSDEIPQTTNRGSPENFCPTGTVLQRGDSAEQERGASGPSHAQIQRRYSACPGCLRTMGGIERENDDAADSLGSR